MKKQQNDFKISQTPTPSTLPLDKSVIKDEE